MSIQSAPPSQEALHSLFTAVFQGDLEKVRQAAESGVDLTAAAEQNGHFEEHCTGYRKGDTALHIAAKANSVAMLILLLEHIGLEVVNDQGDTPLLVACKNGKHTFAQTLVEYGANVDVQGQDQNTPLHCIARARIDTAASIELVAEKSLNSLDAQNARGETPLVMAGLIANDVGTQILLDLGAHPNIATEKGETPLRIAASSNRPRIVHSLMEKGAEPDFSKEGRYTALHAAAVRLSDIEAIKKILSVIPKEERQQRLNAKVGDKQCTVLHYAVSRRSKRMISALVKFFTSEGADLDQKDTDGKSPRMILQDRGLSHILGQTTTS